MGRNHLGFGNLPGKFCGIERKLDFAESVAEKRFDLITKLLQTNWS